MSAGTGNLPSLVDVGSDRLDVASFERSEERASEPRLEAESPQGHPSLEWGFEPTTNLVEQFVVPSEVIGLQSLSPHDYSPSVEVFSSPHAGTSPFGSDSPDLDLYSAFLTPSSLDFITQISLTSSPQEMAPQTYSYLSPMGLSAIPLVDMNLGDHGTGFFSESSPIDVGLDDVTPHSNDLYGRLEITEALPVVAALDLTSSPNADHLDEGFKSLASDEKDELLALDDSEELEESTLWLDLIKQELAAIDKVLSELHDLDLRHEDQGSSHADQGGQDSKLTGHADTNIPSEDEPSNPKNHGHRRTQTDVKQGGMVLLQTTGDANIGVYDLTPALAIVPEQATGSSGVETQIGIIQEVHVGTTTAPSSESIPPSSLRAALERSAADNGMKRRTQEPS